MGQPNRNASAPDTCEASEDLVEACEVRFNKLDPKWKAHLDDTAREAEQAPAPKLTEA